MKDPEAVISLVVALAAAAVIFFLPGTQQQKMGLAVGYALLVLTFFFGMVVLAKMITGAIDLSLLVGEAGGGASMSRFQLLIFTFVIALSFFFVVVSGKDIQLPNVPANVLALLGISATTYGVSKGIQAGSGGLPSKDPEPSGPTPKPADKGQPPA